MKLLCSVGRLRRGDAGSTPASPSRIIKNKELYNILKHHNQRGIFFYFNVLLILCVLFYCTEFHLNALQGGIH